MKAIKQINDTLKKEGRTKTWLASQIGITPGHLGNILNGRKPLKKDTLENINNYLGTNFK
jgi:plasmid maintenance system antidote protein VapI